MIYSISQITFTFLTQIYYNMNFIIRFHWHFEINLCQLLLEDFFCSTQKMHVSEYVCKICLREQGILLKCRKAFEIFLAECNSSKNTGLPQFFFIGFWQLYSKNINFLTKIYIYIGEDQEFIHIFYWCIPLDHEIYTK